MDQPVSSHFIPGPIQKITSLSGEVSVSILRLDLVQSWATGNKFYKLKYALQKAIQLQSNGIVSMGGMFSNHLAALAEACHVFNLPLVCMIRSYAPDVNNPAIQRLYTLGCQIELLTPDAYDAFDEGKSLTQYPGYYFIGEGGLSTEGIDGAAEIVKEILGLDFNHVLISGGTMCTSLGILKALPKEVVLHIMPAWKGCDEIYVQKLMDQYAIMPLASWDLWKDEHLGGFGKFTPELIQFMRQFTTASGIPLDPVYTGKLLFGFWKKLNENVFDLQDRIMVIHTGGLQGLEGYAYRFPEQWKDYAALVKRGSIH